ncbi:hypothetical protein MtrunA17_Chr2g0330301 [Medicago truncatula]|uniref:Uncharacterized protein n=1 Tax=Medicago truncatula TaxID=3880 RepID=A0A396JIX8_MEDTR|nr:hypothetical protein MtrunA17_Chr2g0330301 [Medicago truncatula]
MCFWSHSVINGVLAVRKNAYRPRRQVVMHISKSYCCKSFWIVVSKECSTSSRLRFKHMSLHSNG